MRHTYVRCQQGLLRPVSGGMQERECVGVQCTYLPMDSRKSWREATPSDADIEFRGLSGMHNRAHEPHRKRLDLGQVCFEQHKPQPKRRARCCVAPQSA